MRDYLPLFGLGMWVTIMMTIYAILGWLARREQRRERDAALTAAPESHPKSAE